jgi:glutaredoxin-dependent peroxiredoxin
MTLEVGELAPPFTLMDRDRNQVTLESFPGKHLVLAFFPLAFTGG